MRSIKFKAKRVDNGEWIEGYYVFRPDGKHLIYWKPFNDATMNTYHEVIPETVCQFTGLTDKNGVEIWEGDNLVDYYPIDEDDESKGMNESLMPVTWCEKTLQWCVDSSFFKDGGYLASLTEYFGEHLEVIGNIHDKN